MIKSKKVNYLKPLNFYIEFLGKEDSLFLIGLSDYFLGYILDEVEEENDMEAPFKPRKTDMIYIDNLEFIINFFRDNILNKDIKTDEDLFYTFNSELENNNDFYNKFRKMLDLYKEFFSDYFYFSEKNIYMILNVMNEFITDSSITVDYDDVKKIYYYVIRLKNNEIYSSNQIEQYIKEYNEYKTKNIYGENLFDFYYIEGNKINENELVKTFRTIIKDLTNLICVINYLLNSGYPKSLKLNLVLKNNILLNDKKEKIILGEIIEDYKKKSLKFNDYLIYAYENFSFNESISWISILFIV